MKKITIIKLASSAALITACTAMPPKEVRKPVEEVATPTEMAQIKLAPVSEPAELPINCERKDEDKSSWKDLLERADQCVRERNWRLVEEIGFELGRKYMKLPWGAYFLSLSAEARADFPRAQWMAELSVKKSGEHSGLFHYQLARIYLAMRDMNAVIKEIKIAVAKEPTLREAHSFLASVYERDLELEMAAAERQLAQKPQQKLVEEKLPPLVAQRALSQ